MILGFDLSPQKSFLYMYNLFNTAFSLICKLRIYNYGQILAEKWVNSVNFGHLALNYKEKSFTEQAQVTTCCFTSQKIYLLAKTNYNYTG